MISPWQVGVGAALILVNACISVYLSLGLEIALAVATVRRGARPQPRHASTPAAEGAVWRFPVLGELCRRADQAVGKIGRGTDQETGKKGTSHSAGGSQRGPAPFAQPGARGLASER